MISRLNEASRLKYAATIGSDHQCSTWEIQLGT